ncbi:hypothetical protein GTO27_10090 [Candidatus Bathyarchaeota archaeon]|nr:hypothetical protein [Candidatus Bathyarchaeota archaeon]
MNMYAVSDGIRGSVGLGKSEKSRYVGWIRGRSSAAIQEQVLKEENTLIDSTKKLLKN